MVHASDFIFITVFKFNVKKYEWIFFKKVKFVYIFAT